MNLGSGVPTGRGRRLVFWALGGLTLAVVGVGLTAGFLAPALELDAAEQALRQHDVAAARTRLDRYLTHRPNDPRALLLAARAARRGDACADAERFLTAYEERSGATPESRLEWVLLGVQQGDFADNEDRLRANVDRNADALATL